MPASRARLLYSTVQAMPLSRTLPQWSTATSTFQACTGPESFQTGAAPAQALLSLKQILDPLQDTKSTPANREIPKETTRCQRAHIDINLFSRRQIISGKLWFRKWNRLEFTESRTFPAGRNEPIPATPIPHTNPNITHPHPTIPYPQKSSLNTTNSPNTQKTPRTLNSTLRRFPPHHPTQPRIRVDAEHLPDYTACGSPRHLIQQPPHNPHRLHSVPDQRPNVTLATLKAVMIDTPENPPPDTANPDRAQRRKFISPWK